MCVYSFKEIAHMYNRRKTPLFVAFIDIKSAFDKVCFWKLFMKLIDRKVPKSIIQFLVFSYVNQGLCTSWGNYVSNKFYVTNGIKQGSILSPYLFSLFLLLGKLILHNMYETCLCPYDLGKCPGFENQDALSVLWTLSPPRHYIVSA